MEDWSFLHVSDLQPGSLRSFRFNPAQNENGMTAYRQLSAITDADLLIVGGDLTRDGSFHDFEYEEAKAKLDALPYPYRAIPGNMDTCNKHTPVPGATGRDDPRLNVTQHQLDNFAKFFGEFPWSFVHKNVRFSGFYAAVAATGYPHEARMWEWLENELPNLEPTEHHVMNMHYTLFFDDLNEPNWDITTKDEYQRWYFTIDNPHRSRMFEAFKASNVEIVTSGHIHCRRPEQVVEGIRFYRCAGIAMRQWEDAWPDSEPALGFYRFDVTDEGICDTFMPLEFESKAEGAYGKGGHPHAEERDYSLAQVPPPEVFLKTR
jgi:predicted MPP superfamily phosphohydrolase